MSRKPLLSVCILAFTVIAIALSAAEDSLDFAKVRRLHQKVRSGEKLTPEEQAYYEQGKAARRKGEARAGKTTPTPPTVVDESKTSTGLVPLCDMGKDRKYKEETGGLYGNGDNTP